MVRSLTTDNRSNLGLILISASRNLTRIFKRLNRRVNILPINDNLSSNNNTLNQITKLRSTKTRGRTFNARLRRRNNINQNNRTANNRIRSKRATIIIRMLNRVMERNRLLNNLMSLIITRTSGFTSLLIRNTRITRNLGRITNTKLTLNTGRNDALNSTTRHLTRILHTTRGQRIRLILISIMRIINQKGRLKFISMVSFSNLRGTNLNSITSTRLNRGQGQSNFLGTLSRNQITRAKSTTNNTGVDKSTLRHRRHTHTNVLHSFHLFKHNSIRSRTTLRRLNRVAIRFHAVLHRRFPFISALLNVTLRC